METPRGSDLGSSWAMPDLASTTEPPLDPGATAAEPARYMYAHTEHPHHQPDVQPSAGPDIRSFAPELFHQEAPQYQPYQYQTGLPPINVPPQQYYPQAGYQPQQQVPYYGNLPFSFFARAWRV